MKKKQNTSPIKIENELIAELEEARWIKQPVVYTLLSGDFSLMQTSIMIGLIGSIQDRINAYLKRKKEGDNRQLSLFTQEEIEKEAVTFKIDFSSINVRPDAYDELDQACQNLIRMSMSYPEFNENGKTTNRVYINLFSRIKIPTNLDDKSPKEYRYKNGKRRKGYIEITMLTKNMSDVFDMSRGYVNHIAMIAQLCRRKRTPRIYIYLERWKNCGHKTVNLMEFKEYLGLMTWDRRTGEVKEDVYPKFSRFCASVLDPVKKEMDDLAAKNLIDISFDYEPIYKRGKGRSNPDEIKFTIHMSEMGRALTRKSVTNKKLSDLVEYLKKEYGFTDKDLFFMTDGFVEEMFPALENEVHLLKEKEERYQPQNKAGYAMACLRKCVNAIKPQAVNEETVEDSDSKQTSEQNTELLKFTAPTDDEQKNFREVIEEINAQTKYKNEGIFKYLKLLGIRREEDGKTCLKLVAPTRFYVDQIETEHLEVFRESLFRHFPSATVTYEIDHTLF